MREQMAALPAGVVLASEAEAVGVNGRALGAAVRAGLLVRLRSGAYQRRHEIAGATPEARHLQVVRAAARQLREPVFSHESAAVVWGLPVVAHVGGLHVLGPHAGDGAPHASGRRGDLTRHAWRGARVVETGGLRVTSALDTVAALASGRDLLRALPAAEAAVTRGLVTPEEIADVAAARSATRGVRTLRSVAALVDGRSESPGESVSRARIHLDGFDQPELQTSVVDRRGVIGRVDFWWPGARVVGEFDGRVKYRTDGVDDRRAVEDRVWAEKRREDRIRATGARVARWTWQDAWRPGALYRLLTEAGVPRRS